MLSAGRVLASLGTEDALPRDFLRWIPEDGCRLRPRRSRMTGVLPGTVILDKRAKRAHVGDPAQEVARERADRRSVPEVSLPGQHHGEAEPVGGGDHLGVPQRATGLDDGGRSCLRDHLETIGEGKKGIGGGD